MSVHCDPTHEMATMTYHAIGNIRTQKKMITKSEKSDKSSVQISVISFIQRCVYPMISGARNVQKGKG